RRRRSLKPATVLFPHALIEAIVEIEVFHVLELGTRGGEQFLGRLDMPVHRAADIEEQKNLNRVVALGTHQNVEISLVRCTPDAAIEIEFFRGAGAREFSQAA